METTTDYQQELMEAFHFDEPDLMVNRTGRMSKHQLHQLTGDLKKWGFYALAGFVGAILLTLILVQQYSEGIRFEDIYALPVIVFIVSLIAAVKCLFIISDRSEKACAVVEGQVTRLITGYRGTTSLSLKIGMRSFRVNSEQYFAVEEDARYRIYYTPNSDIIVAVEALEGAPPTPATPLP